MEEEVKKIETEVKREWPAVISSVGGIATLIGFCATLGSGAVWLWSHYQNAADRRAKMAMAQSAADQGDYETAIRRYDDILKDKHGYPPAREGKVIAAEQWVENLQVAVPEGQDPAPAAAAMLDQIMPILEAGLTRAKGTEAADVQAHIGWAHWLNRKMAGREFGTAAEDNLRAALQLDPQNVYANAMLGNWLLQTHGDFGEAMQRFNQAVAAKKELPLVRALELGGLLYLDQAGARAALVRATNEMRKGGERLDDEQKSRIRRFCFDSVVADRAEFTESLRAIPPDEEWLTYQWLDTNDDQDDHHALRRFVDASLLEVRGDTADSLEKFRTLARDLRNSPGSLRDQTEAAIQRLQG